MVLYEYSHHIVIYTVTNNSIMHNTYGSQTVQFSASHIDLVLLKPPKINIPLTRHEDKKLRLSCEQPALKSVDNRWNQLHMGSICNVITSLFHSYRIHLSKTKISFYVKATDAYSLMQKKNSLFKIVGI